MSSISDVTTPARIRHAALEVLAEAGFAKATVRAIAERAGVSAGLVIHHFGSKEKLRQACDDWVFKTLLEEKELVAHGTSLPQLQAYLAEHPEFPPIVDYLTTAIREGGATASRIFTRMCALTRQMFDDPHFSTMLRPAADPEAVIAITVAWSIGITIMGEELARSLGGTNLLDPTVYARYSIAATDLLTNGLFTDQTLLENIQQATVADTTT